MCELEKQGDLLQDADTQRKLKVIAVRKFCSGMILLVLVFGQTSCATLSDQMRQLQEALRRYEYALRWQDFDLAMSLHKNVTKQLSPEERKHLKQFKVTAYNVKYSRVYDGETKCTQIIEIGYYIEDRVVLKEMTIKNEWEYDEDKYIGRLTNDYPEFK